MSRIKPKKFNIENKDKKSKEYAWNRIKWIALAVLPLFGFGAGFSIYRMLTIAGAIAAGDIFMLGVFLVAVGILVGAYFHYKNNPIITYKLNGITFAFDPDYYVPKDRMEKFIVDTQNIFYEKLKDKNDKIPKDKSKWDEKLWKILRGIKIHVVKGELYARGRKAKGATWPQDRSVIYGPYVLDEDVLGYELKLHICQYLFPNRPEKDDIGWMKENGVI